MTENQNPNQTPDSNQSSNQSPRRTQSAEDVTRRIEPQADASGRTGAEPNEAPSPAYSLSNAQWGSGAGYASTGPGPAHTYPPTAATSVIGKKKRRVPLVPAILAGSALFIVGGLAGGAVGASVVIASSDSGTSQGPGGQRPGGQGGMGGPGGQQGGTQNGGGTQQGGGSDGTDDTTSATPDGGVVENAAVTHFEQVFTGFAVLYRDE